MARIRYNTLKIDKGLIMDVLILPILDLLYTVIGIYKWVVIISVLASWLVAFGIINTYSAFVSMILEALYKLTEPALQHIRKVLPAFSGVDLSPIVLLLALHFLQNIIARIVLKFGVL